MYHTHVVKYDEHSFPIVLLNITSRWSPVYRENQHIGYIASSERMSYIILCLIVYALYDGRICSKIFYLSMIEFCPHLCKKFLDGTLYVGQDSKRIPFTERVSCGVGEIFNCVRSRTERSPLFSISIIISLAITLYLGITSLVTSHIVISANFSAASSS
jgi:hypothetical protein